MDTSRRTITSTFFFKLFFYINSRVTINTCVQLCDLPCLRESRSIITYLYSLHKFNIANSSAHNPRGFDMMSTGAIPDLLSMRDWISTTSTLGRTN